MTSQSSWFRGLWRLSGPISSLTGGRQKTLDAIHEQAEVLAPLSDNRLLAQVDQLRQRVANGCSTTHPEILVAGFALIYEAFRRVLSIELYDVQLQAGLALVRPAIAEMQTGEGKTFAASLPAFVYGLSGRGVHIMTVNDYLAQRDYEQLKPVYEALGLSVGFLPADATPDAKRTAYRCDITYGSGCDYGFDYLRDQAQLLARGAQSLGDSFRQRMRNDEPTDQLVQRGHAVAIVDEVDSVLLDEATTPLVLAWGGQEPTEFPEVYRAAIQAAARLEPGVDFQNEGQQKGRLTRQGNLLVDSRSPEIPTHGLQRPWRDYVETALRAEHQFRRDVEYIVRDDEILLVDQHTGRIFPDRSWQDGLHQAVQAKEGVTVTKEQGTLARITRQRFFRLYDTVCGMTGTATISRRELGKVYGLGVIEIPTHRTCRRQHEPPRFFADQASKRAAIADDVAIRYQRQQPVLVGTQTIEESQLMARLLDERHVPYQVLNGKQDQEEAEIVACAGSQGTVTIATNMAGRGTDIPLGPGVSELGGLHVVVCEPHESARVDRQLMGRSARQGDPGSCQQFVAADDPTVLDFAPQLAERMQREVTTAGELERNFLPEISQVQRQVELLRFQQRRQMYAHDDWLESMLREFAATE